MPIINIVEKDLTRPTGMVDTDIAYIPGTSFKSDAKIKLCSTVAEFETAFGELDSVTITAEFFANPGIKSYVMAKSLLSKGMMVLYDPCNDTSSINMVESMTYSDTSIHVNPKCVNLIGNFSTSFNFTISLKDVDNYEFKEDQIVTSANIPNAEVKFEYTPASYGLKVTVEKAADASDDITGFEGTISFAIIYNSASTDESQDIETINSSISKLADKGEYNVKYITTGGYDNMDIAQNLLEVAKNRGDCVVFIEPDSDATYAEYATITNYTNGTYGTCVGPWKTYKIDNMSVKLPGCYAYLSCLADSIKTSPNWLAIAGVTRGLVANLDKDATDVIINNVEADNLQPKVAGTAVNAITNIKPYGMVIWGNRTLAPIADGLKAGNFLNTRNMISDIKKVCYTAAKALMFEQNSDTLWARFKGEISPLLDRLKSGNGIADYKITKSQIKANKERVGKGELACNIRIYPLYAVEEFDITVSILDQDVAVE